MCIRDSTDTLEAQKAYSCLWSSALDAGSPTAETTVHLRAGEKVLAASNTFAAHINVLYAMEVSAVGDQVSCNVTGAGVDVRLAATDDTYDSGFFGLEVYKGNTAFFQAVTLDHLDA